MEKSRNLFERLRVFFIRRPSVILFLCIFVIAILSTKGELVDKVEANQIVSIKGTVISEAKKDRYTQYRIGECLVNDYSNKANLDVGDVVEVKGKSKLLGEMKFDDFNYGRYLKSTGIEVYCTMSDCKKVGISKPYKLIGKIRVHKRYKCLFV